MADLRTEKTRQEYLDFIAQGGTSNGCNLCKCDGLLKEFEHWRLIENRFPYDLVAKVSHILITKRHIACADLNEDEKREYDEIKATYLVGHYDSVVESLGAKQSIPSHFHVNLLVYHD